MLWDEIDVSRSLAVGVFLLLAFSASAVSQVHAAPAFSESIALNTNAETDSGNDDFPFIVGDRNGRWVSAWSSADTLGGSVGSDSDILVATSFSNGSSWTAPVPLAAYSASDVDLDDDVTIETDGEGTWIIAWSSEYSLAGSAGNDRDLFFVISNDNGNSWSSPALLNTNANSDAGDDRRPSLINDGQGRWMVAWESNETLGGSQGLDYDIFYSVSLDSGASWSAPSALNTLSELDSGNDVHADLFWEPAGLVVAVWMSAEDTMGAGSDFDIAVSRTVNFGDTWAAQSFLNGNAADDRLNDSYPEMAGDGQGNVLVAWQSQDRFGGTLGHDWDVMFSFSDNQGATWAWPGPVNSAAGSDGGIHDRRPTVATDGLGTWLVAWESNHDLGGAAGADFDIHYAASTDGSNWSSSALIDSQGGLDIGHDYHVELAWDGLNWLATWSSWDDRIGTVGIDTDIFVTPNDGACTELPRGNCRTPYFIRQGMLQVVYGKKESRDKLVWKWQRGFATSIEDFGNPDTVHGLSLCAYDSSGPGGVSRLVYSGMVAAGGLCHSAPCWRPNSGDEGWRYKNSDTGPSGIQTVKLKPGGHGQANIRIKGKGASLDLPLLPLFPEVLVQARSAAGTCWESTFTTPVISSSTRFKARSD